MAKLGDISAQGRSSLILALVLVLSALLIFSAFVVADPASPGKPSLIYPADGAYENDNTPTFRWENGAGADNHRLLVDNDSNFSSPNENRIIFDNFYTLAQENSLPDGTYYWKVIAINADGENESAIRTFVIDTVAPPFMALLSPADNSIMLTNTPTFTWGMVADPSGVTYTIQIDNDQDFPSLTHENSGLVNNSYTLPGSAALPSGKYYWRVRAVDGAGNQGTWSDVWRLTVDGVPPVVSSWKITKIIGGSENLVDFENGTYTNDNTPFISAIVTDDAAGVKDNMQLLLDGNVVSHTYHPENGQVCHQVPSENSLADNEHTVELRVWDNLGNYTVATRSFKVDRTYPARPQLLSPPDCSSTNDNTTSFDWFDVDDNAVTYTLQIDNKSNFSTKREYQGLAISEFTIPDGDNLVDNLYYWRVLVKDGAGNENVSEIWQFTIDTVGPGAPTLISPAEGENVIDNTPLFQWSSVSGTTKYRLQIDNDSNFSSPAYDNSNITDNFDNFKTHSENSLADGLYYWRVAAMDDVGNTNWSSSWQFTVDTLPPSAAPTLLAPENYSFTNDSTPTFRWTAVSDPAGVYYKLWYAKDNEFSIDVVLVSNILDNTYTPTTALGDDNYYWRVQAIDSLGHIGPLSPTWKFTVDTIVAAPTLLTPENGSVISDTTPEFDWADVVDGAGVVYTLEIDDDPNFGSINIKKENLTASGYTLSGEEALGQGTWYWRVRVRDNTYDENGNLTGNENKSGVYKFVIDTSVNAASLIYPVGGVVINDNTPTFDWSDVVDQVGPIRYYIFVDNDAWDPSLYEDVRVGEQWWRYYAGAYLSPVIEENDGTITTSQYTPTTELPQGTYKWKILVADGVPNFAWSAEGTFTVDKTPPTKPVFVTPEPGFNPYDKTINDPTPWFCWENASDPFQAGGAITYELWIDNENTFAAPRVLEISGIPDSRGSSYWYWGAGEWYSKPVGQDNIINYELPAGYSLSDGTYYWRVRAIDNAGNRGPWVSDYKWYTIDTTPPSDAPTLSSPSNGENTSDNTPTLSWGSVSGAAGYEVQYALNENFTENLNIAKVSGTSTTTPELSDSVWYWRVRARDTAWNWGPWSSTWRFRIDSQVESPTLASPTDGTITNDNTPYFSWTAVIDSSTPVTYRLQIDNDSDFSSPIYNKMGLTDNQHTAENVIPDGTYYWRVAAIDNVGNIGWSASRRITIDTSAPPAPTLVSPDNNSYTNDNTPTFTWTRPSDPSTVTYDFQLDNDSDCLSPFYENSGMGDNFLTLPTENALTTDNVYYWRVRARDSWGHVGGWSAISKFTLDTRPLTEAPLLVSPQPGENTRDNTPTFEWTNVENASRYELWVDNDSNFSSPAILENTAALSHTPATPLADGTYYWRVRALDAAGNLGTNWSDTWSLRVDNTVTAPNLVSPADDNKTTDNTPTFSWLTVADPSSPVTYRLQIDNDSNFASPEYDNANVTGTSCTIKNELPDENYYWRVWARDNLGNQNVSASRTITVDVTPPSSNVDAISPYWKGASFTITASASDATSGVKRVELQYRYSIDNLNWGSWTGFENDSASPWSWTFTSPSGDGYYQFRSIAEDHTGNVESAPGAADAIAGVDNTAPETPTLVSPENDNYTNDNTPFFDWQSVSDLTSVTYTMQVDNETSFSPPLIYNKSGIGASSHLIENELLEGRYYWRVRAVDTVGNIGNWSAVWQFVVDITPPSKPILLSPENNSGFDDNTPTFRWTENVDQWVPGGYENYTLVIDNDADFSSPTETFTNITDNMWPLAIELTEDNYYWRVRAFDKTGNASPWAENFVIWSYVGAPTLYLPDNSSVVADNRPTFMWFRVSDPSPVTYHLQVDNESTFASPVRYDNSSITDNYLRLPAENALHHTGTWYWRVSARDNINPENWSENWQFTYSYVGKPVLSTGSYPENAKTIRDNTPLFRWDNGANASKHRIVVDNDSDLLSPIDNVLVWGDNKWTKPSPGYPDGTYYWSVLAIDNVGTENRADNMWQFTINTAFTGGPAPLISPDNDSYTNDDTPLFRWTTAENAAGPGVITYELQIDDSSDFSSPVYSNISISENQLILPPENALSDKRWYWRVRAKDDNNNKTAWAENTFTVDTAPPTSISLQSPENARHDNDNRPTFVWSGGLDSNFVAYRLQVDNESTFSAPLRYDNDNISGTSLRLPVDNALNAQGTWNWRVSSRDRAGNVRWSENRVLIFDNVAPSKLTNLRPENNKYENDNTPTFRWTENIDEWTIPGENYENYTLVIDNDPDFGSPWRTTTNITDNENTLTIPLPDGTWYWRVMAYDKAKNASPWSDNFRLIINTQAPGKPTLLSPANNTYDNTVAQTFRWTEPETPENYTIHIARDVGFTDIYHENTSVTDNSYDNIFTENNVFYWRVRAKDQAGNASPWSDNWRLVVDTAAPGTPTLVSPENNENVTTSTPAFDWSSVADLSGVTYTLQVDNENSFTDPFEKSGIAASQYTLVASENLVDNTYYWRVRARDKAGNNGSWTENRKFRVDTGIAAPTLLSPDNNSSTKDNTPYFRWTAVTDTGVTYTLKVDNDSDCQSPIYENSSLTDNCDNFDTHPENALADGTYYWQVVAHDSAGNENASQIWRLTIDNTVGKAVLLSPQNNAFINDNTPFLDWRAVSDPSGVTYELQVDNEQGFSPPLVYNKAGLTISEHELENQLTDNIQLVDNYYWRVRATDGLGNVGLWSDNWKFILDTVAPSAPTLYLPADNAFENDTTPTLRWYTVENADNYMLHVAQDNVFTQNLKAISNIRDNSYELTAPLSEGVWYWRVRAGDNAGNLSENWSSIRKLTIDIVVPPAPTLLSPLHGTYDNDNTPTFVWYSVYDLSGVTYRLQMDNDSTFDSLVYENTPQPVTVYATNAGGVNFTSPENVENAPDDNYAVAAIDNENRTYRVYGGGYSIGQGDIISLAIKAEYKVSAAFTNDNLVLAYSLDNGATFGPSRLKWIPTNVTDATKDKDVTADRLWSWENIQKLRVYLLYENSGAADGENVYVDALYITYTATSFTLPLENALADGGYYWRVVARDNASNENTSRVRWFLIDTVAPAKPTLETPQGFAKDNNTPKFDWLGVPNPSGVVYEIQVDNENAFDAPRVYEANGLVNSEIQLAAANALPDGVHYWRVRARDRAGNAGDWSDNLKFTVDTLPPKAEDNRLWFTIHEGTENEENRYTTLADGTYINDARPRIWAILRDYGAGAVDNVVIWLDNKLDFSTKIVLTPSYTYVENRDSAYVRLKFENKLANALPEDNYYFRLMAWDNIPSGYGGPHLENVCWRFVIDITAPPPPGWGSSTWYKDNTPTFSWDESTDPSGIERYHLQIAEDNDFALKTRYDNQYIYDDFVGDGIVYHTIPDENSLPDFDNYYRRVRVRDNAGNWSDWSYNENFVGIDTVAPTSSVNDVGAKDTSPFTVTATASDPTPLSGRPPSGVENVTLYYDWSNDNSSWQGWTYFGVDTNGADGWSWSFNTPKGENYYRFYSIARDKAGNVEVAPAAADAYGYYSTGGTPPTPPTPPPSPDFSISVSPSSGSVPQGSSTTATVSLTKIGDFDSTVNLSASGVPSGVSVGFSPSSGTPSFTSTMTISVSSGASVGTYSITITGAGGAKTHATSYSLTITSGVQPPTPSFSISSITPSGGTVQQGSSTTATITLTGINNYSHSVSLSASGQPSGVNISFSPGSGVPSFTSKMTITAGSGASTGNYDITVRAQGEDGMVRSTFYSLTVTAYTPPPPPPEEGEGIPTIAWAGLGLGIGLVVVMMVIRMRRGPEEWAEGAKARPKKGKEKEPEF